ncbi:MAG TPA: hypothetical protein DCZ03_10385, partial [Gammaproteobacteria bacterium]|nr:hypothetical protein [Gammaproteobacteria bacterium]
LITGGVGQIYLSSKQTFRHSAAQAEIQENGRFAMGYLRQNIRNADFWGCGGTLSSINNHIDSAHADFDSDMHGFARGVEGIDGGGTVSDSLWLRRATGIGVQVNAQSVGRFLDLPATSGFSNGDIGFVSDCANADLFYIWRVRSRDSGATTRLNHRASRGAPGNAAANPNLANYSTDAKVYNTDVLFLSIGNDPMTGESALLRAIDGSANEVYVGNVENMQLQYGIDQDADGVAERYATATAVNATGQWDEVISIRVALLVASTQEVRDSLDTNTYQLLDVTIDPVDDRRLRQVYTSTIMIRNRLS